MRLIMVGLFAAFMPLSAVAAEKGPTWRGTLIAATADPIPVRDLRGRKVKSCDYRKDPKPVRPPTDHPKPPEEGFWIGPSITVGAGDYLPRDRSERQRRDQCLAASSGPPSASSAINSAASADGRRCEASDR